jgi:hypothetical protein
LAHVGAAANGCDQFGDFDPGFALSAAEAGVLDLALADGSIAGAAFKLELPRVLAARADMAGAHCFILSSASPDFSQGVGASGL